VNEIVYLACHLHVTVCVCRIRVVDVYHQDVHSQVLWNFCTHYQTRRCHTPSSVLTGFGVTVLQLNVLCTFLTLWLNCLCGEQTVLKSW